MGLDLALLFSVFTAVFIVGTRLMAAGSEDAGTGARRRVYGIEFFCGAAMSAGALMFLAALFC